MNENSQKLLEALAQKLGTTTEYLWGILIKQAPIDAAITLFQIVLVMVFGIILFRIHKKMMVVKEYENGYGKESGYEHYNVGAILPMVVGCFVLVVFSIISFLCIPDVVSGFFNPEYWALNKVLYSVK